MSLPLATAQEQLMVFAMGHTDHDHEVWAHRRLDIAMPRTRIQSYRKRRRHTMSHSTQCVDASFRPCFLELLQASGCAHDVEVWLWVQDAGGFV